MAEQYECTEITVDARAGRYSLRLWIGTNGLATDGEMREKSAAAMLAIGAGPWPTARQLLEHALAVVPNVNAVQVKLFRDTHAKIGLMAYTQPFANNDRERFGA